MGWLQEWLEIAKLVIAHPKMFFADMGAVDEFEHPVKFAVTSHGFIVLVQGVTGVVGSVITGELTGSSTGMAAVLLPIGLAINFVVGIGMVFLIAAIIHGVVYLFGGRGYVRTFAVLAYATAIGLVGSLVSNLYLLGFKVLQASGTGETGAMSLGTVVIALVLGAYMIYVQIIGVREFHGLSTGRAAVAVFTPVILGLIILLIVAALFFMAMSMGPGPVATTPPATP